MLCNCAAVEGSWRRYFVCWLESSEWLDTVSRRRLPIQGQCLVIDRLHDLCVRKCGQMKN